RKRKGNTWGGLACFRTVSGASSSPVAALQSAVARRRDVVRERIIVGKVQLGLKILVSFECPVYESDRLIGELRIADRIIGHSPRERRHRVKKQTGHRDIRVPPAITIKCWRPPRLHHATPRLIQWPVLLVVAIRKY